MVTKIHIRKDRFKFSAAHMTVFDDGTKEALHGHNYQTELTIESKEMIPFAAYKEVLQKITAEWDEKVLIAAENLHLQVQKGAKDSYTFSLCGKQYALPKDEVVLLKTENTTSEELSRLALEAFLSAIPPKVRKGLTRVSLRIDESGGQGATSTWSIET